MKRIIAIAFCLSGSLFVSAQLSKVAPHSGSLIVDFSQKKLVKPYTLTERRPLTTLGPQIKVPSASTNENLTNAVHGPQYLSFNSDGMPKAFEQSHVIVPRDRDQSSFFADYLIKTLNLSSSHSFDLLQSEKDVIGTNHYKYQQTFKGIPVINGEYTLHQYGDQHVYACGYAWNLANINTKISISVSEATNAAKTYLASKGINITDQKINAAVSTGVKQSRLCIYKDEPTEKWVLAYQIHMIPNLKENWELFVDAQSGQIIDAHSNICRITHDHAKESCTISPTGAETASAIDLSNNTRTINVWKEGSTYYLIDASRPMFQASRSKFPDNPIGVLITYDFKNRNVETSNSADYITSTNNSWSSKTSVSAHLNGAAAYEYYRQTHGRNSIDGTGGTIISVINVQDGGGAMDNAFWNGEAMFYGNGARAFTPLAKGLDVAGHEMSHGVIGSTANLAYQSESGAINESFADVFGAMIDRDDWKIGEDVVITSVFRSGALRDLSDPHNGGSSLNDNGYQPRHVNEQYKGTEDNGGVHINSGIPNYAFYTFVTEMAKSRSLEDAKKIGEKVYYYALTKLLTRSSNFKDLRAAIEKSCMDLYSNTPDVLASAKTGFERVGIGSSGGNGGSTANRTLKTNPGQEYIVCTDENQNGLYIYDFNNNPVLLTNRSVISKPSVTDNGQEIYYVGSDKKLYALYYNTSTRKYTESLLDNDPIYRNVAISKDGYLLAAVLDVADQSVYIYNFDPAVAAWKKFKLYNPSYSNTVTGDVQYADVMDFSHDGEFLMYDANNIIKRNTGDDYEYWDIGFLRVFNNSANNWGDGKIEKLVASLPDGVTIGNPVFSKNSLDVIAFDYIEDGTTVYLVGSNIESNDFQTILQDRPVLSYSNYSNKDNYIIFDGEDNIGNPSLNAIGLATNKIQSSGSETVVLQGAKWGVWFADGARKLTINTTDPGELLQFAIQPNPCNDFLNITFASGNDEKIIVKMIDLFGNIVRTEIIQVRQGLYPVRIETGGLKEGQYFLQATGVRGSKSVGFVKISE